MLIRADFDLLAFLTPDQQVWGASPQPGVERVMLDRIGVEKARATSLVRYAVGAAFSRHAHAGGEEILVLSGVFSDEHGDYPQGWYLRNPPGSSHQPFSRDGAVIFVKLEQMRATDHAQVRIDTHAPAAWHRAGNREICQLFRSDAEQVSLQRLPPGECMVDAAVVGAEMLILEGSVLLEDQTFPVGSWIRLPAASTARIHAGPAGAMAYLKTGHLAGPVAGVA